MPMQKRRGTDLLMHLDRSVSGDGLTRQIYTQLRAAILDGRTARGRPAAAQPRPGARSRRGPADRGDRLRMAGRGGLRLWPGGRWHIRRGGLRRASAADARDRDRAPSRLASPLRRRARR